MSRQRTKSARQASHMLILAQHPLDRHRICSLWACTKSLKTIFSVKGSLLSSFRDSLGHPLGHFGEPCSSFGEALWSFGRPWGAFGTLWVYFWATLGCFGKLLGGIWGLWGSFGLNHPGLGAMIDNGSQVSPKSPHNHPVSPFLRTCGRFCDILIIKVSFAQR